MLHRTDDGGRRRFGTDGRFFTMTGATVYSPDVAGVGTQGIVEAIGRNFVASPSRYARSSLMTFGRSDQNVPGLSAEVPQGNGRAILALAIIAGALLLLTR